MTDPARRTCGTCACFQAINSPVPGGPDGFCYLDPPQVTEAERQSSRIATPAAPNPSPMRGTLTFRPPVRAVGVCWRWRPLGCRPGETAGEYSMRLALEALQGADWSRPELTLQRVIESYLFAQSAPATDTAKN